MLGQPPGTSAHDFLSCSPSPGGHYQLRALCQSELPCDLVLGSESTIPSFSKHPLTCTRTLSSMSSHSPTCTRIHAHSHTCIHKCAHTGTHPCLHIQFQTEVDPKEKRDPETKGVQYMQPSVTKTFSRQIWFLPGLFRYQLQPVLYTESERPCEM